MGVMTTVGDLPAYRAVPGGQGPWPAMVLVHELFGLDDVMRRHADRLAEMGFLVLAPDLMARGRRILCLARTMTALRRGSGRAFDDIEAARAALAMDPRCSGPRRGHRLLHGRRLRAPARRPSRVGRGRRDYGTLPDDPAVLDGACPVVASYGGRDRYLPGAAAKLEAALTARGVVHDVRDYPRAGHAFLNDEDNAPWYLAPMTRLVMRAGPEPASAEDAWGRIEGFLRDHLTR